MDNIFDKRVVQDIVASNKRTIGTEERIPIRKVRYIPPQTSHKRPRRKFPSILITFIVVFIGIAVMAVALSLLYSKAVVTITPKSAHFDVNGTPLTAKKTSDSSFGYEVLTLAETLSQAVPAVDGPLIETKAKGTAILYNEQPTQQKIVAGTRLSNADGLIYRTTATVVIPHMKDDKTPGNISVIILADQSGANYNMLLTDGGEFKIVAYKGGPKYSTVYGKQKTSVTGGFSGNKKIISPEMQKATVQSIEETLKTKLIEKAKALIPNDSVLYKNTYTIEYEVSDLIPKDNQTADISVKGTLYGAQFKKNDLLKSVAVKELDKFSAPTYRIEGIEDLKFTLINAKDFSAKKGTPLIFSLKGPISLFGTFSETALKNELKGTYLKESNAIFAHYPAISNAYALITPFWMRYFPNSPDKITIEMKN